jgi:phage terminase large subunit-like protein
MIKAGPKPEASTAALPPLTARTPAGRVEEFFRRHLRHVKGEWAGQPLELAAWQKRDIVRPLFNARLDGRRRYRTAYVEVPRKNAKSTLAAGLALYLLYADREPGAEIISAAADRQQAHVTFDIARNMVEASPELAARTRIYRRELVTTGPDGTECTYRVISSEAYSKHGLNLSGAIVDELHAHESGELLDVLRTSFGARRQPLLFMITTAGFDRTSVCWAEHEMALKVRDGVVDDPSYLPVIYAAELEDDWTSRAVWKRANPGYGVTIKADYLAQECRRAQSMPAYENAFKRLHLNLWTEQSDRWLPVATWDACDGPADIETLAGRDCYGGLDLASTTDIAALTLVFPSEGDEARSYTVIPRFWIPRARLDHAQRREPRIRDLLAQWAARGLITATPGDAIDYDVIRREITALTQRVRIREIGYDRWGATQLSTQLQGDGIAMVEVGQGFASMSAPTKDLERLLLERRIAHGGHPVLRWMFSNLAVRQDAAGNLKPDREKASEKIDGIVALIMAIDRAGRQATPRSVYDTRGVIYA